ncbi:MAG: DUF3078 domain-containing protein [Bacteroidaceae bacterium]|nr:DUF3078 domain-containing protein [Bacteroidaceae bacterium]
MKKCIIILLVACILCPNLVAKTVRTNSSARKTRITQYADSVGSAFSNQLAAKASESLSTSDESDVTLSPYLFKLIGQGMYYSSAVKNSLDIDWDEDSEFESESEAMQYRDEINRSVDDLLASVYTTSPAHFSHYDTQLEGESLIDQPQEAKPASEQLEDIFDNSSIIHDVTEVVGPLDVDLQVTKPNFWKTTGRFSLQFTQNYMSENWYKGGDNNGTMLSQLFLSANYNDQKRIQWDNSLDLRLGFVTTSSDSCHNFLTNNDKINLNSKFGVKASKSSWYYTFSMQAYTQFLPGYKSNDRKEYSNFLAPLDVNASIGMDYKPKLKNPDNSLSLALLPLSYKLRYIGSDDENIHSAYSMIDESVTHDFGSRLEYTHSFKLLSNLSWRCRLYYYTTYEYVEMEMENAFSFSFNKYLTADFYTLWRFDDNRNPKYKDDNLGYFQFKEYLTLGLSYSF